MTYFIISLPALLFILFTKFYWKRKITNFEIILHFTSILLISAILMVADHYITRFKLRDVEIHNGFVESKHSDIVPCSHQYVCGENCTTDSKGNKSCSPVYCNRHLFDTDWIVKTTVGNVYIDRVNESGSIEPKRYKQVVIGEPASLQKSVINYLLGNKDSLFYLETDIKSKYHDKLLDYPRVTDYYRFNRILNSTKHNTSGYNELINNRLKSIKDKQINLIIIITNESIEYFKPQIAYWNGGKKNDVILAFGLKSDNKSIEWFNSTSFADGMSNKELHSNLRQLTIGTELSIDLLLKQFDLIVSEYKQVSDDEFSYIDDSLSSNIFLLILYMGLTLTASIFLGQYFSKHEVKFK